MRRLFSPVPGVLLIIALILLQSCGRKAPPSLKAFEKPEAPSMVSAVQREDTVILSWTYLENLRRGIRGFHLFRSDHDGFEKIAFIGSEVNTFTDRTSEQGRTYKYKIVAQNFKGILSGDSNVITITTGPLPDPPRDVRVSVGPYSVELSWSSSGEGVCYNVYKTAGERGTGAVLMNRVPICGLAFVDGVLTPDETVYYSVRAVPQSDPGKEGYSSREVGLRPDDFIPSPPSDLRTVKGEDRVFLIWRESPESWVRGYRVYRRREGEPGYTFIGRAGSPSFADAEISDKKTWYMIRAVGPTRESEALEGEFE